MILQLQLPFVRQNLHLEQVFGHIVALVELRLLSWCVAVGISVARIHPFVLDQVLYHLRTAQCGGLEQRRVAVSTAYHRVRALLQDKVEDLITLHNYSVVEDCVL